ncbi:MAG TPA: fumarylacetoacetate hydrolase family protein [Solirubrobacterales bacterium]|nr:fumarylacetoacetate hydrolase family protein [Solirubrobacterales bacterium]
MRLVSYRSEEGICAGVQTVDGVLDAGALLGERPVGTRRLIEEGRLDELAELAKLEGEVEPASVIRLLPPVPDPDKIICIGLNYRSHAAEAGIDPPEQPTFFAKFRNALAPPGATVALPAASERVDYEAEIAFVIGRRCKEIDAGDAADAVAGFMLFNDLSARDLQFATPQWMPGKVFDGSAPCGPALVTPGEAGAPEEITFALDLNGERMQEASTSDLIFSVAELLARLSRWMTLEPGDIVSTGTPAGVGSVREPRVWLKSGDEIVISSPTLGELHTTIGDPAIDVRTAA